MIPADLQAYIEHVIVPRYDTFDRAHNRVHVRHVIDESRMLAIQYGVSESMAYVVAAYHDLGLQHNRAEHHLFSARILMEDSELLRWFTPTELQLMSEAVEDHRASANHPPRSIYGCIVAEADRDLAPTSVVRRTIQFGLKNYPDKPFDFHYRRAVAHLQTKYGVNGYLQLWLKSPKNVQGLADIRTLIADRKQLQQLCYTLFVEETQNTCIV